MMKKGVYGEVTPPLSKLIEKIMLAPNNARKKAA